jgi:hypothetical protein
VDELDLVARERAAGHALDGVPRARPRPVDHDDELEAVGRQGLGSQRTEARRHPVAGAVDAHHYGEVTHPAKVVGRCE